MDAMSDVKLSLALNLITADPERATPQGTMAAAYVEAARDREALQERYSSQYCELGAAQHRIEQFEAQIKALQSAVASFSPALVIHCDGRFCPEQLKSLQLVEECRVPMWLEAHGWAARGDEHLCKRCKEQG
jgi:hypothetical protein